MVLTITGYLMIVFFTVTITVTITVMIAFAVVRAMVAYEEGEKTPFHLIMTVACAIAWIGVAAYCIAVWLMRY